MRKQVIIKEKLKFPSGTATALMISVLHGNEKSAETESEREGYEPIINAEIEPVNSNSAEVEASTTWELKMKILLYSFLVSGLYVRMHSQSLILAHIF